MPFSQKDKRASSEKKRDTRASDGVWKGFEPPRIPGAAIFEWNIAEGTTWFSEEWESIIQEEYDPTAPNNLAWWEKRLHPEDMPKMIKAVLAVQAGFAESYALIYRFKRGDGTWRRIYAKSAVTQKSGDGAPLLASGVSIDMTDILPEDYEHRGVGSVSEVDYQSMLENSPDLFIRFRRDLTPVYVNPPINRYLGGTQDWFDDKGGLKRIRLAGDYKTAFQKPVERVFTEGAAIREEIALCMSDGREATGECSFWPEYDSEGRVEYAMAHFRDITEQRRMEQRATLNEKRLEALYRITMMENAPEAEVLQFVLYSVLSLTNSRSGFFFIPDEDEPDKGYLLWSEDHYSYLDPHHLPDNYLPQDLIVQMTDAEGRRSYRSINNGDGVTPLYVVFDGRMAVMRGIIAPGMEGDRVVCVAGVCNKDENYDESELLQFETFINSAWLILRRRRFVHELQKAKDAAESANKAKDAFLANVSHELRTPLNGVLSMLQLIDSFPMAEQQREYLLTAQASGKALLRIISDLLDFSCMESGRMPLDKEVFDCRAIVQSALDMFEDDAAGKGLSFTRYVDAAIPRHLLGDEARIRQVIFNVVGNALKFTSRGGITVTCARQPQNPPGKEGIILEVTDTGIGIPRDKLSRIFDAFTQMGGTHRRKYSGTGLGLSIVKHLAGMMDGSVSAVSEEGKGTTVRCELFFDIPSEELVRESLAKPAVESLPHIALDILVAEDDDVGSVAIRAFLQKRGHRVVCVEDGIQAIEALRLYPFHCLFTDITMPRMDGLELVKHIREGDTDAFTPTAEIRARISEEFSYASLKERPVDKGILIVAVSAHSMIGDKERFLSRGMDEYISKPILKEELDSALRSVVLKLGVLSRAD